MQKYNIIKIILANSPIEKNEMQYLLKYVTKQSLAYMIANPEYQLDEMQVELLYSLVYRRILGEPFSYIIGYKEFYSYNFIVNTDTLIPRPETELIIDVIMQLTNENDTILDLGTGSGCIAISCKKIKPTLTVVASDKYPQTLSVAKLNAYNLNANVTFIVSDWFNNIAQKFDLIVSNPPYIAYNDPHLEQLQFEPLYALTDYADGYQCIKEIIIKANDFLNNKGFLVLEHGYNQRHIIENIIKQYNMSIVENIKDYSNLNRIIVARKN